MVLRFISEPHSSSALELTILRKMGIRFLWVDIIPYLLMRDGLTTDEDLEVIVLSLTVTEA